MSGDSVSFEFFTAARIVFGRGLLERIGELAADLGRSALIVSNADRTGRQGLIDRLTGLLGRAGVEAEVCWIRGEPEIIDVDRGLEQASAGGRDLIVGLGGGSAIDAAKAVAGLLTNGGSCLDYMEVIGEGRPIRRPAAPWIAVPTTAGTGAEVTRNAVIGSRERGYKASIRSPLLLPRIALVDPELSVGLSREVTARTGMDALTQCIESFTSSGATPLTDGLAIEGIRRAGRSLRRACDRGNDATAREDMALAALISGITLTNAGLGAVHGIAAPLGARYPVPHGTVCAALLPHVVHANVTALREAAPRHPALARYARIGRLLGRGQDDDEAACDAAIDATRRLVRDLEIPGLGAYGLSVEGIPDVVEMARQASSMRFNPIELDPRRLSEILRRAL